MRTGTALVWTRGLVAVGAGALLLAAGSRPARADVAQDQAYAQKLFQRLTGTPLLLTDQALADMTKLVTAGDLKGAAHIATTDASFYDVTVRDVATPMSVKDGSPLAGLNDFQATFIGAARDDLDARTLLTGSYLYEAFDDLGLPPVDSGNNDHFTQFDTKGFSPNRNLRKVDSQYPDIPEQAGLLTSRAWAEAHYNAGTNRRSVRMAIDQFLCTPIEQWRDHGLLDYHVHRDVDRHPGGDPSDYQNRCRNCHAPMDGMVGAFARFDYVNGHITHSGPDRVAPKYNQHAYVYPDGYITLDDSWVNYATVDQNTQFGWRGATEGQGINAFGTMLASSRAFSRCMTKRAFQEICRRAPVDSEAPLIETLTDGFEGGGYKLRALFEAVATQDACIGRND